MSLICADSAALTASFCSQQAFAVLSGVCADSRGATFHVREPPPPPPRTISSHELMSTEPYRRIVIVNSDKQFREFVARGPPATRGEHELAVFGIDFVIPPPETWGSKFNEKIVTYSMLTGSRCIKMQCYPKDQPMNIFTIEQYWANWRDPTLAKILPAQLVMDEFSRDLTIRLPDFAGLEHKIVESSAAGSPLFRCEKLRIVSSPRKHQHEGYVIAQFDELSMFANLREFSLGCKADYNEPVNDHINIGIVQAAISFCTTKCPLLETLTIAGSVNCGNRIDDHCIEVHSSTLTSLTLPAMDGCILVDCPKLEHLACSTAGTIVKSAGTDPRAIEIWHTPKPRGVVFVNTIESLLRDAEHAIVMPKFAHIFKMPDAKCAHIAFTRLKSFTVGRGATDRFDELCFSSPCFEELWFDGKRYGVDDLIRDECGHMFAAPPQTK